jgi:hypothetical protein
MAEISPSYVFFEPATWDAWVAALGFAAASKLAGACMTYFFHGEVGDDVKLTRAASALFEAERVKLDGRRAKLAARGRAARQAPDADHPQTAVDKSEGLGKSSKKSRKTSGKVSDYSAPAGPAPAQTVTYLKPKFYNPQTPAPGDGARGAGGGGVGCVSPAEFAAMAAEIGYSTPNAYGLPQVVGES